MKSRKLAFLRAGFIERLAAIARPASFLRTELSVEMRKVPLLLVLAVAVASSATAQTQTRERRSSDGRSVSNESTAVPTRVVTPVKNHSHKQSVPPSSS